MSIKSEVSRISKQVSNEYGLNNSEESSLSRILSRLVLGTEDEPVIVSPYAERLGASNVIEDFNGVFDKHSNSLIPTLLELEMSQKDKMGPRSIAKPWTEIRSDFMEYFKPLNSDKEPKAIKPEQQSRLRPSSVETVISNVKNSTSSGLPNLLKKGSVKNLFIDSEYLKEQLSRFYPCVPFIRTQERGKTRVVWGFPISSLIQEGTIFYPLLSFQKKLKWRSALRGPTDVDKELVTMVKKCNESSGYLLSIDFSAYDTTVKRPLITLCFEYVKSLFQDKYSNLIDEIKENFITVPMVTPDGIIKGDHGIPSGSYFTNEIGSLNQYIISKDSGIPSDYQIQGDDGVYCCSSEEKANSLSNYFTLFGLNVNKEKSYISPEYCIYLQKLYHIHYIDKGILGGIYPVYRALNRILYQERFVDFLDYGLVGQDYYSIRTISILENCKFHPLYEELVKFILSLDKYKLKYSENGLSKYVEMLVKTEGSEGLIINQFSDNVRGIANFTTTKLINKLS